MNYPKPTTQEEFEDLFYNLYCEAVNAQEYKTGTVRINPIIDKLIRIFHVKTRNQFNQIMTIFLKRAVNGKSKYKIMLEVDRNWREWAAAHRTKYENKLTVDGKHVYIVEMKLQ